MLIPTRLLQLALERHFLRRTVMEPLFEIRLNVTFYNVYDGREIVEFLEKLFQLRLTLTDWSTISAGASLPEVAIRGTRKNLTTWIIHYFERNVVRIRDLPPATEETVWAGIVATYEVRFVG